MGFVFLLKKISNWSCSVFDRNIVFIILFFLFNVSLNLYEWDKAVYQKTAYVLAFFLWSIILFGGIEAIRHSGVRLFFKVALLAVPAIVFIADLFALYTYKILIGPGVLTAILETNANETREFIKMYVTLPVVGLIIGSSFFVLAVAYYSKKIFCQQRKANLLQRGFQIVMICGLLGTLLLFAHEGRRNFTCQWGIPAVRIYFGLNETLQNIAVYQDIKTRLNTQVALTDNSSTIKNVVLIIGESTNRNHMGLYGYHLNTTPRLGQLKEAGELFVFSDVISPHSHTVTSLRKMLTFYNYESQESNWYEHGNLIDIMNQAGYKTFWLSNQESSGVWGNIAKLFASRSSVEKFTTMRSSEEEYAIFDEKLLPVIETELKDRGTKNFFVVHLMGTHSDYKNRYPQDFSIFTEKQIKGSLDERKKVKVAEYDNAVYYNDFIVTEIMNKFRDDEAIVIYLSDHGECVYDDGSIVGHTEEKGNRFMVEIPMLIWVSNQFQEKYPGKVKAFDKFQTRGYMTDDLIHTVLDIVDVQTAEFDPARSIVNNDFNPNRKRIYNHLNYDAVFKAKVQWDY